VGDNVRWTAGVGEGGCMARATSTGAEGEERTMGVISKDATRRGRV
jgi:hypothetical protein